MEEHRDTDRVYHDKIVGFLFRVSFISLTKQLGTSLSSVFNFSNFVEKIVLHDNCLFIYSYFFFETLLFHENIWTQNSLKVGNTVIMRLYLVQSRHCSRLLLQEEVSHESDFLDDEKIESTNKNPFLPIFECCME